MRFHPWEAVVRVCSRKAADLSWAESSPRPAPSAAPGHKGAAGWIALCRGDRPRIGHAGVPVPTLYWVREQPPCALCGRPDTLLIFCQDNSFGDAFNEYSNAAAEVECRACGGFSVYLMHHESRS